MYLNFIDRDTEFFEYVRLTLTWDVFKYLLIISFEIAVDWLTLTWDVFKF